MTGLLLGTAMLLSCSNEGPSAPTPLRCPPVTGEFPPDGCARLAGQIVSAPGSSLGNLVVAVDTVVRETDSRYVSSTIQPDASGRFKLLVVQVRRLGSAPVPELDSIRLELKLYATAGAMQRREPPIATSLSWMFFGRWGDDVRESIVSLRLPAP